MMQQHSHMTKVKVVDLLQMLDENKKKHVQEYKLAMEQYRLDVIEDLEKTLKSVRDGGPIVIYLSQHANAPQNHTDEYDGAIMRYQMEVESTVYLDNIQFDNYVRNKWNWQGGNFSNTMYASKAAGLASR